jgi:O-antigen/teichoic acid export membrane protein
MKQLAGQTAIYGLSSVLGRMVNFLLVPLQTAVLTQSQYGINIDFYSLIAFLIVVATFGMETAYFRFSEKKDWDESKVFGTSVTMILLVLTGLALLTYTFKGSVLQALRYEESPEFLVYLFVILSLDALAAIPFARLRRQNKAKQFAGIKLALIFSNVLVNLYFFLPALWELNGTDPWFTHSFRGVKYIFIANMWASLFMFALLIPAFKGVKFNLDKKYTKGLLAFGIPLFIGGLAGIANEMLDRQLLKYLLPKESWSEGVGIYGAVYKISIFLVLFNQAFRYAAEPFFFKNANLSDGRQKMASIMEGFAWVMCVGFVLIISGLDFLKFFIDDKFWVGLHLVPILLLANVILGINTNLNMWYKVSDKTTYGIYITFVGLAVTVLGNLMLIPKMGILGAAITTLVAYTSMFIVSAFWGQRFYPVPYRWGKILALIGVSGALGFALHFFPLGDTSLKIGLGFSYLFVMIMVERDGLFKFAFRK